MTTTERVHGPRPFEMLILGLELPPFDALYRVGLGYFMLYTWTRFNRGSGWAIVLYIVGILFMLRVVPMALRAFVPWSSAALAKWSERRQLAKRYDSYQWRKLFWIGVGFLLYIAVSGDTRRASIYLAAICLAAGAIGQAAWRQAGRIELARSAGRGSRRMTTAVGQTPCRSDHT